MLALSTFQHSQDCSASWEWSWIIPPSSYFHITLASIGSTDSDNHISAKSRLPELFEYSRFGASLDPHFPPHLIQSLYNFYSDYQLGRVTFWSKEVFVLLPDFIMSLLVTSRINGGNLADQKPRVFLSYLIFAKAANSSQGTEFLTDFPPVWISYFIHLGFLSAPDLSTSKLICLLCCQWSQYHWIEG